MRDLLFLTAFLLPWSVFVLITGIQMGRRQTLRRMGWKRLPGSALGSLARIPRPLRSVRDGSLPSWLMRDRPL